MALGYVTAPAQTAKIHHQEQNTEVFVDQTCLGKGVVYITEDNVVWQNVDGTGFELYYPNIQLHAISRDKNAFSKDCLFLMVEGHLLPTSQRTQSRHADMAQNEDEEDEKSENGSNLDAEDDTCCEVRFCPDNVLDLEPMFQAMNQCQELHPDPTMNEYSGEEDEGECDFMPEFGSGDQAIIPLSHTEDIEVGAPPSGMEQFFSSDGQFSDDILRQLQAGQQVHIDFTTNTATTTPAAPEPQSNTASNGDGLEPEGMEMEQQHEQ